jgi:beta-glucosidase
VKAGQPLQVEVDVKNTGSRPGDEVAQLYLVPPQTAGAPLHTFAGFERVHLLPGQSRHLTYTLDARQLSFVDEKGVRADRPGQYALFIGGSQPADGAGATTSFQIEGTYELPH